MKNKSKKKVNKDFIIGLVIAILMIVVEFVSFFILKYKLSSSDYSTASINTRNIITIEFLLLAFIEIITLIVTYQKEKVVKVSYIICILLLLLNFYLIAFQFCSYGNFINTCILFVYTRILKNKKINEETNK